MCQDKPYPDRQEVLQDQGISACSSQTDSTSRVLHPVGEELDSDQSDSSLQTTTASHSDKLSHSQSKPATLPLTVSSSLSSTVTSSNQVTSSSTITSSDAPVTSSSSTSFLLPSSPPLSSSHDGDEPIKPADTHHSYSSDRGRHKEVTSSTSSLALTPVAHSLPYSLEDTHNNELLSITKLNTWDFPIFDLASQAQNSILSQVSIKIIKVIYGEVTYYV